MSGMAKRTLNITCSNCGGPWDNEHRCPVPPTIDTTHYSDEALRHLADYLLRVLDDRAEVTP